MMKKCILQALIIVAISAGSAVAGAYPYRVEPGNGVHAPLMPVIGYMDSHQVKKGETLLDIAREYGLGFNEIALCHPDIDPWLPGTGNLIDIPTFWILPSTRHESVVVNIPEMRLYRFFKKYGIVKTYPIGIGRKGFETPVTECRVTDMRQKPAWTVPPYARKEYKVAVIPPGPENPLGDYWIGLSVEHLGIHGTNFPWGVGRQISHGCIRLYPEHIEKLFGETGPGTRVEIIYEPVKIGVRGARIYLEVHPDIYGRTGDLLQYATERFNRLGIDRFVDRAELRRCIEAKSGIPTCVGAIYNI